MHLENKQHILPEARDIGMPRAVLCFVLFLLCIMMTPSVLASPLRDAKGAFVQGDLPAAAKVLEQELLPSPKLKGKELEEARGLFGIIQFMLGNESKAESVFRQMLKNNPNASLDKRYLLDPAVEPYFRNLKKTSSAGSGTIKQTTAPAAGVKKPQPGERPSAGSGKNKETPRARAQTTPPPEKPQPKKTVEPKQEKVFTGIIVSANAPQATVFADGIFVGSANQKIALQAGKHLLSISAEGYRYQEQKIKIEKGQTLQIKVTLAKVQPAGAGQNIGGAGSAPDQRATTSARSQTANSGGSKKSMNFNQDLPVSKKSMNFNQDLSGAKNPRREQKTYTDQYFQEPQQQAQQQPPPPAQYSQPPTYPPPSYAPPQQPYAPYPQSYAPQYQQPYPAPYMYAPPPVYAQPPVYIYPDPYGQSGPYGQPGYGAPNPYEEEYEAGDSYAPRSSPSRARRKNRQKGSGFIAILPLGIGQFQNGETGKGVTFLLLQAGAGGYAAYIKLKAIPDANAKFAAFRLEETELSLEEQDALEIPRSQYLQKMDSYFQYSLIGAGVVYVVGVIDALSNLNSGSTRRRAAELPAPPENIKKYNLALSPTLEGGMKVDFSLRLD